jgi:hypothetical protein
MKCEYKDKLPFAQGGESDILTCIPTYKQTHLKKKYKIQTKKHTHTTSLHTSNICLYTQQNTPHNSTPHNSTPHNSQYIHTHTHAHTHLLYFGQRLRTSKSASFPILRLFPALILLELWHRGGLLFGNARFLGTAVALSLRLYGRASCTAAESGLTFGGFGFGFGPLLLAFAGAVGDAVRTKELL